jgi:hypothetical protein
MGKIKKTAYAVLKLLEIILFLLGPVFPKEVKDGIAGIDGRLDMIGIDDIGGGLPP